MEDNLIELLEKFGFPVIRQGSLAPDAEYPDTFFTFWCLSEIEQTAYDNGTFSVVYDFYINVYSTNPEKVYDLLRQARILLKNNGWTCIDRGHDVQSDVITHIGRGMEMTFLNTEEEI